MTSNAKDIIKLRPVSKAIDEDESSRLKALEFEVPRKYCAQISPEMLRFTELKRSVQQHRTHILKKLMKIARYTQIDRQFEHISDLDASEKVVPHGEVSKRLYSDIFKARDFDLYGKMMPPTSHAPRKHMELAVTAQNLGIEYTQKVDNELVIADILKEEEGGDEEEGGNEGAVRRTRKLLTQKWKIGYVDSKKPPVGFAKNPGGQFRSHGNEYYYSYDGEWWDGKMDGSGVYLFSDGFTYEGCFKEGQPDGQGVAYYPDGQRYEGQWGGGRYKGRGETFALSGSKYEGEFDAGRRSGTGTITYPSGLSYTGDFYDGKPHGRGRMLSALTGWSYEGGFHNGFIRGSGVLFTPSPEKRRIVYYWSETREDVTLPGLVRLYLKDKDDAIVAKEREKHSIYAPLRGAQLKQYVTEIRDQVTQEKLAAKKEAYNKAAAKAKEDKRLLYEARIKALAGDDT